MVLPSSIKSPGFSPAWLPTSMGSFPVLRSLKRLQARSLFQWPFPFLDPLQTKVKNLQELPCDPAVLLLGLYLKETKPLSAKIHARSVFTAALFATAKMWSNLASINRWLEKKRRVCMFVCVYIHINTQRNAFQKEWKFATCSNMDELICLVK